MNKLGVIVMAGWLAASSAGCTSCSTWEKAPEAPWQACFEGLSNQGANGDKLYVTAGRKAQIVGTQDARFPDLGNHVEGEMGGIWTGSFKVADGFWMKLADVASDEDSLLVASEMRVYPHQIQFDFGEALQGLKVTSSQFASDTEPGIVVSYTVQNTTEEERSVSLGFLLNTDLFPVWFSEENGIHNGNDQVEWNKEGELFTAKDSLNDWHMAWKCDHKVSSYEIGKAYVPSRGTTTPTAMYTMLCLKPGQKEIVRYAVASSVESASKAMDNCRTLLENGEKEIDAKKSSIEALVSASEISVPDKNIQNAYYWTLINNRWLETEVDTIGYFLGAGAVEYPWLFGCDNSYALQGVLRTGKFDLVKSTLRLLNQVSERANGNGRIIHEMSNNGLVGNRGNTQETAHYILALWKTYTWTGDKKLLAEIYPNVKKGIAWLTETMDTNRDLFPEGYGIMEVKGLNAELIDVAVYTQQALAAAAQMAEVFQEDSLAGVYRDKSETLKQKINQEFWDEEAVSYCDFYGSKEMALQVAEGAIEQAGNLEGEDKDRIVAYYRNLYNEINRNYSSHVLKGWFTNKNWVINTPMECKIAPEERALRALETIYRNNCGEYGPYLSAVERKHMMTIATGVQAVSEANYDRIDRCMEYLQMIANTLGRNMPGAINEMMPDYGCPYQAWTIYGMATGLISGCFGVEPRADLKEITITPQLPSDWESMSLKRLRIGDNRIDLSVKKENNAYTLTYSSAEKGWKVNFRFPGKKAVWVKVNNKRMQMPQEGILLADQQVEIVLPLK